METSALLIGIVLAVVVGGLGVTLIYLIAKGKIDLTKLISETDGTASLSRFQFLVFTFVISMSLFLLVVSNKEFPTISAEILALLGISGGSYVVSKGIQASRDTDEKRLEAEYGD